MPEPKTRTRRPAVARPAAAGGSRLVVAADAAARLEAAVEWLAAHPADAPVLLLAPSLETADEIARSVAGRFPARFGLRRMTLPRLAVELALPGLAASGRAPAGGLALSAVAARAIHALAAEKALSYFAPVASRPGFPLAVSRTVEELRMNGVAPDGLEDAGESGADLARLLVRVERELAEVGLADRAAIFAAATEAVSALPPPDPVGQPLLLLDLEVATRLEADLVAALAGATPARLATAPAGDERSAERLERALGCRREAPPPAAADALARLKTHLFADSGPAEAALDDTVTVSSWPGEARECVEIARAILAEAARGVRFDRMAVFLRAPGEYRAILEEALRRAGIPAHFARGTVRPDPAGRALLALLACASERLSARRFGEYLSLAQVPGPESAGDAERRWSAPDHDLLPAPGAAEPPPAGPAAEDGAGPLPDDPRAAAAVAGSVRAPWRWERLIVDASVIGGEDRWARRLAGLEEELGLQRRSLGDEEEARAAALDRQLADLEELRRFALPVIGQLAALPERATWGVWLERLRTLAAAALRTPEAVLATLAELEPMAPVGPIALDEVRIVLAPRLADLTVPPARRRYGAVTVAPAEAARGACFDVVFVPGLAERIFPRKIVEDPILLDEARRALAAPGLATQPERVAAERLLLRLAAGAARRRLHLSYPRIDVEKARPRVPSFYALETLRAAEGRLPGFERLGEIAETASGGRLGWPAPERPEQAIDDAEYDLALLAPLLAADPGATAGAAHYLLGANPHLARALRARARRWLRRWTPADGLVDPEPVAREALARHQLATRSFSPTALQNFAACPYRFFLQTVVGLEPREEPVAVETLDPLTRGSLFHEVQFELLTRLRADGLLPVGADNLEEALARVDEALDGLARRYADRLAPAIPRVWEDAVGSVRADLREWLRREAASGGGWVPSRFELAFGLAGRHRPNADPASDPEPVGIAGGLKLRGAIDLVERHPRGALRATDHKTGKARAKEGVVVGGGQFLQPALYALACERLLPEPVEGGRLYYCTADGEFRERFVPLDAASREAAAEVAAIVGRALEAGFLPAAPDAGACAWCDYRPVCGPLEEIRTARKPADRLADLRRLRGLP